MSGKCYIEAIIHSIIISSLSPSFVSLSSIQLINMSPLKMCWLKASLLKSSSHKYALDLAVFAFENNNATCSRVHLGPINCLY